MTKIGGGVTRQSPQWTKKTENVAIIMKMAVSVDRASLGYLGTKMRPKYGHFGGDFGPFLGHFWGILGSFWHNFGVVLVSF